MMEIKKCTDKKLLKSLWKEAFGDTDEFIEEFFNIAFAENRFNSVFIDNELAGALYWFDAEIKGRKTAYIYAVATAKKHRGKGIASSLLNNTLNLLKEKGYEFSVLVPSSKELFRFYEKLGFYICGYVDSLSAKKSDKKAEISKIGIEEYINLRSFYNAENSIFMAKENIDFIKNQLMFFKGKDFICAITKHNNTVLCKEILGNTENLGDIVSALSADSGSFRTIGNTNPFVMGYSLTQNSHLTDIYFPFAFD